MSFSRLIGIAGNKSVRNVLLVVVVVLLGGAVFGALQKLLADVSYDDVMAALKASDNWHLALAVLATGLSYVCMMGYDRSSMRYIGVDMKWTTTSLTSFIAFSLGNTVGLGALAGGAVRMRLYSAVGLEPVQVAKVVGFNALSFTIGLLTFGATALLLRGDKVAHLTGLAPATLTVIAILLLAGVLAFFLMCAYRREMTIWRWKIALPTVRMALWQLCIAAGDFFFAALTLWILLPEGSATFVGFLAFYMIALALGVLSHLPGGIGVFEVVILLAMGQRLPVGEVAGALLLYRIIYFFLPLLLASFLLVLYTWRASVLRPLANTGRPLLQAATQLIPSLLATLTFIAGLVLLESGVTPTAEEAMDLLAMNVPLFMVESSHMIGSICGLLLLLLARGLMHRLDAAWWGALLATGVGFLLALPKGIAWHEMIFLGILLSFLVLGRSQFNRRSSLFGQTFDAEWFIWIMVALGAVTWILFFAYRNVEYSRQLWWSFEIDADAPRSLRAMMAVALVTLLVALWQLLRRPSGSPLKPAQTDFTRVEQIVARQNAASAVQALSGDKHLLFSESGNSFIMYGKQGRSWIGLYDPVGDPKEWHDLVWQFIEMADAHGGRAVFYQVRPDMLPLYLDAGLKVLKLGEYAWVPLHAFNLKGGARANLRTAVNRAEREGMTFEVIMQDQVKDYLPVIREVSEAWLADNKAKEKGFSLGSFDPEYLTTMPVALVRQNDKVIAFASLLQTNTLKEASIDLMRYTTQAPPGTMDFLFTKLILYFQSIGVERFGLGMAPLSGMADHELAPRWHRFARLLFGHGERFYHFRGLRSFKDKFQPVWEPRYLAASGGVASMLALIDVTTLINKGRQGTKK